MKNFIIQYLSHKDLYITSAGLGGAATWLLNFFSQHTPTEILGISVSIWLVVFCINLYDIHTGIKADTQRRLQNGERFIFESRKGWRAFEKVFVFTAVVFFLHYFEQELVRYKMPPVLCSAFLWIKLALFFYLVLIELQSIGENDEVRFGKKGKLFMLLDNVIGVVNDGIIGYVKRIFSNKTE